VSALLRFDAEKKNIPAAKPIVEAGAANPLAELLIYKYDVFNRIMASLTRLIFSPEESRWPLMKG
jgi:hypothetical protein